MQDMTIEQLQQHRTCHMNNLRLLHQHSSAWDEATRERGEATMANLMQQVYALDAQLVQAGAA